ncbi:MAG TPA: methyltransferase [Gemmataceae bacterium]|jgi:16S rRNA G966 N2-methylase RsmD
MSPPPLALEDAQGHRVVLLTCDLCGMPKWMDDSICAKLKKAHGLERDQIRLTNSHNHCAPAVRGELEDYYPLDEKQKKLVADYSDWLEREIVKTIEEALSAMKPAKRSAGEGTCTFAVNRRNAARYFFRRAVEDDSALFQGLAVALADLNARANGVAAFQTVASSRVEGLEEGSFDVVLANPPYYANSAIARLFIERGCTLLKPDGRFYLVTKQPGEIADLMMETFKHVEAMMHRGYTILCNTKMVN